MTRAGRWPARARPDSTKKKKNLARGGGRIIFCLGRVNLVFDPRRTQGNRRLILMTDPIREQL